MKYLCYLCLIISGLFGMMSCIEDDVTTDSGVEVRFSADTVKMGIVFTEELSPTARFKIFNPNSKGIIVSSISIEGEGADYHLLVNGGSGEYAENVEIRSRDSIVVFVNVLHHANGTGAAVSKDATVNVLINGVTRKLIINSLAQDVHRLNDYAVTSDMALTAEMPYKITGEFSVAESAHLKVLPGTQLYFHDKSRLTVKGQLTAEGTPDAPIILSGDRNGYVVSDIPYEIMSGQWDGVYFDSSNRDNMMSHVVIKNTVNGVTATSSDGAALKLQNCVLHNSKNSVLTAENTYITAVGCEFSDAPHGVVSISGGKGVFNHCTFANNYLFAATDGALLYVGENADVDVTNSIFYGIGASVTIHDGGKGFFRSCLIKESGEDDEDFVDILWESDPMFVTDREEYLFDYRLKKDSPAIGAANPELTLPEAERDFYGNPRGLSPDMGAYKRVFYKYY